MNSKIDWKKYVDKIYCIHYVVQNDRLDTLYKELDRVDILNSGLYYQFDNIQTPLYKKLFECFTPLTSIYYTNSYSYMFDTTMAHYYCMKHALANGYKRILILENDIRFLKDKNVIIRLLESSYNNLKLYWDTNPCIILGNVSLNWTDDNKFYDNYTSYDKTFDYDNLIFDLQYYNWDHDEIVCAGFNIYNELSIKAFINIIENFKFTIVDNYYTLYKYFKGICAVTTKHIVLQNNWIFPDCTYENYVKEYNDYEVYPPTTEYLNNIKDNKLLDYIVNKFFIHGK